MSEIDARDGRDLSRVAAVREKAAQRQGRRRKKLRDAGIVPVTVLVPKNAASDLRIFAEALCTDPRLECGLLRNASSGRLCSPKSVLARRAFRNDRG